MRLLAGLVALLAVACSASSRGVPATPTEEGAAGDAEQLSVASCGEHAREARDRVEAARLAHLTCHTDADCTLFDVSTSCGGECPQPVAAAGVSALRAQVAEVDRALCGSFAVDGCPVASPGCAPGAAVCREGSCRLEPRTGGSF